MKTIEFMLRIKGDDPLRTIPQSGQEAQRALERRDYVRAMEQSRLQAACLAFGLTEEKARELDGRLLRVTAAQYGLWHVHRIRLCPAHPRMPASSTPDPRIVGKHKKPKGPVDLRPKKPKGVTIDADATRVTDRMQALRRAMERTPIDTGRLKDSIVQSNHAFELPRYLAVGSSRAKWQRSPDGGGTWVDVAPAEMTPLHTGGLVGPASNWADKYAWDRTLDDRVPVLEGFRIVSWADGMCQLKGPVAPPPLGSKVAYDDRGTMVVGTVERIYSGAAHSYRVCVRPSKEDEA